MSSTPDLSKYSVHKTATVTIDCDNNRTSVYFPLPNDHHNAAIEFIASVYPGGAMKKDSRNVLLLLEATKLDPGELFIYFAVSLVDGDGEKRFIKGFNWTFLNQCENFFEPIISLDKLTKSAAELRPNGHLKVVIEAWILEEKSSTAPVSTSLKTDLELLLQTGKFADVVLLVKKTTEFKAHKNILAARSPVFAAMFEHDCKESRQNRVDIPDVEVEVFEELLRYLYTDQVHSLEKYAIELYIAADKYQVEPLKNLCKQALLTAISADTFSNLLNFADSYNITELQEQCFTFFAEHHKAITAIEDWEGPLLAKPRLLGKLVKQLSAKS